MGSESPDVVLYDASGNPLAVAGGTAVPTSSIMVAGSDGTNLRFIATDSSGHQIIVGDGVAGTPAGGVVSIQGVSGGTNLPVSQGTTPWTDNITQFGGVALSTGTGASGTGIPRVTVANDSNILATQSGTWTVQPGNTANTTPWLTTINQGGNSAVVKAATTPATISDPALVVTISPNIGATGQLPVNLDEAEDVFSQLVIAQRLPQIQIPFFAEPPSNLLTITTSGTGTATQGTGTGVFATGTGTTSESKGVTFGTVFYSPHQEIYAAVTASFTTPTSAASFQRIGIYNSTDGFAFGYNGTTFGIWTRYNSVDTFVAKASWNVDTLTAATGSHFTSAGSPVSLTTTNINLYRIRFGWLGIAPILFEVLSPDGNFVVVHNVRLPNSQTTVSVTNPNMPLTVDVSKTAADATNLIVTSGCWVAGSSGPTSVNFSGIDTINSLNDFVSIPTVGVQTLGWDITGTWSGTISFQYSFDGINWINDSVYDDSTGTFVGTTTVNNDYEVAVGASKLYRLIATAWSSGSAMVSFNAAQGNSLVTTQTFLVDANNNGPAVIKPANTVPIAADPALVVVLSPNQPAIPVTTSPLLSTPGIAQGYVQTSATTNVPCSATTYTEQSVNFTGSIKSSSANDTAAGTGARTVIISYVDQTGATAGTETVTLNGTTAVNLVTTTKCFIERIEVVTVGSGGTNAGIISLFNAAAGGGTLVTTIAAGDNRTYHGHHYVISGQTCNITGMTGFNSSTSNQTIFTIQAQTIPAANQVSVQVSDWVTGYALTQALRTYGSLIKVPGPARVQLYSAPGGTPSIKNQGSFDYYDQ